MTFPKQKDRIPHEVDSEVGVLEVSVIGNELRKLTPTISDLFLEHKASLYQKDIRFPNSGIRQRLEKGIEGSVRKRIRKIPSSTSPT